MNKIAYYQNLHLNQLNHFKKELKLRKYLVKNVDIRNKWINNQNKLNYKQEIDNIRTMLELSLVPNESKPHLQKRAEEMKKLLSSS